MLCSSVTQTCQNSVGVLVLIVVVLAVVVV